MLNQINLPRAWFPLFAGALVFLGTVGWVSGLYGAFKSHHWLLLSVDFAIPLVGVIHGLGFLLRLW